MKLIMYNILVNILFTFGSTLTIYFFLNKIDWDLVNKIYKFIYVDRLLLENVLLEDILLEDLLLDTEIHTVVPKIIKYEDKYTEKFNNFRNEYTFTENELELEQQEFEKIKSLYEEERKTDIETITTKLQKINDIYDICNFNDSTEDDLMKNVLEKDICINKLLEYFELDKDDYNQFEELFIDLMRERVELEAKLKNIENNIMCETEMRTKAHESIINKKLDGFINNYIMEYTPLGNVYMRYNNNKKSFEYFSNNTIPYRFLESVARKYVMTFWCKPLFIDIEEELKIAEEKYDEERKKMEIKEKEKEKERENVATNNSKNVVAQFKNYNKNQINQSSLKPQAKNRVQSNFTLPSHIKSNLPNVNTTSDKQLLKERANRYTWEGRLSDFCPLKKIDKKVLNKNLALSFADFKRLQKETNRHSK
jgi:hypothetical protein